MRRIHWIPRGWVVAIGLATAATAALGQETYERDVTVTGPRGRTIQRQLKAERTPDGIRREVHIQRPAGTYDREVSVQRRPAPIVSRRPAVVERHAYAPGPRTIIRRDVVVDRRPSFGAVLGIAAPAFGVIVGSPPPPPPPPVFVVPEPVYVEPAPPPLVVYNPPRRYAPAPPPETVVVDPVADALGRLDSGHDNSRRDGALTLGRIGDARAVPALLDRLRNDDEREVRMASAWALGEIGHPGAALGLQRAALYDKKQEVRATAERAYRRLPLEVESPGAEDEGTAPPGFRDQP